MSDEAPRNFLVEAVRIVRRETRMIPQREHLEALLADAAVASQRVTHMGLVIAAMLVNDRLAGVRIPPAILTFCREHQISIGIQDMPDGSVTVKKLQPSVATRPDARPLAETPKSVM